MAVRWGRRGYTKEQFIAAWNSSTSISGVARTLGCNRSGNGYYALRNAAVDLKLNSDHMLDSVQGFTVAHRRIKQSLESILVENSTYTNTHNLKQRLWSEGLLKKQCLHCEGTEWMGQPMPLALDHINGTRSDNRLENLRILCYNCHGLTPTYGSKVRTK